MYFVNCKHVVNLVRVYTVFLFLVFKFANEKRIPFSFFVFKFCEPKTKSELLFRLSFSNLRTKNKKRIPFLFFVFKIKVRKTKKEEERIRFSFLHLGCFGHTATSGVR